MRVTSFLCWGDVGWDVYEDEAEPRPGGCALNVACASAVGFYGNRGSEMLFLHMNDDGREDLLVVFAGEDGGALRGVIVLSR